jgi:hypothetical protein
MAERSPGRVARRMMYVGGLDGMKRPASTKWWHGSPTEKNAVNAASAYVAPLLQ